MPVERETVEEYHDDFRTTMMENLNMASIEEKAIESRRLHKDESFEVFNKDLTLRMDDWAYGYCQGTVESFDKACEVFEQFLRIFNERHDKMHEGWRLSEQACMRDFRKALEK